MTTAELDSIAEDMEDCAIALSILPDDEEWTLQRLDALESCRRSALRLAREAEGILKGLQKKPDRRKPR